MEGTKGGDDTWRMIISATFTIDPIDEYLEYWLGFLNIPCTRIYGPYNQVFQQLIDQDSLFHQNRKGVNVVYLRWEDLVNLKTLGPDPENHQWRKTVDDLAQEIIEALLKCSKSCRVPLILFFTELSLDKVEFREKIEYLEKVEIIIGNAVEEATGLHLFSSKEIFKTYPVENYYDRITDRFAHVPFTPEYYSALSCFTVRAFYGLHAPLRKVIVLDCDNTLWSGVVGESGASGVNIEQGHMFMHQFIIEQMNNGKILCLCSKNIEKDVFDVFESRDDMLLQRDHFVSWRINWKPKSQNIQDLAEELKLGLDSFIFLDDNPVECAEVKSHLPEILTLQVPYDPTEIPGFLQHVWAFDQYITTKLDRQRTKSYQQNIKRLDIEKKSSSFADFLDKLKLQITINELSDEHVFRVAQLSQRTNQFNATSIRLDHNDVTKLMHKSGWQCLIVHVSDRFGDYGLVGVLFLSRKSEKWIIENIILSCRALGKGVEHRMIAEVGLRAKQNSIDLVEVPYIKSERNKPIFDFLTSLGGHALKEEKQTVYQYRSNDLAIAKLKPEKPKETKRKKTPKIRTAKHPSFWFRVDDKIFEIATNHASPADVLNSVEASTRQRPTLSTPFDPPTGQMEQKIAAIWEEVLRINRIGRFDQFSELGGKSIDLVQIHVRLLHETGENLPITLFFQHPTIESLARYVSESNNDTLPRLTTIKARTDSQRRAYHKMAVKRRGNYDH